MKRTNIVIDNHIVSKAQKITGISTMREVVDHALKELIRREEINRLSELKGAIDWEGDLAAMRASRQQG